MDTLLIVALFWAVLALAALLFGIACIKYGSYTAGNDTAPATLEV